MPNVGSNEFQGYSSSWNGPINVQGHDGSAWKYGIAVYVHNGTTWVEVWNSRPEVTSTSMSATNSTTLSFTGTADPNNFETTAKFEYKEVGAGSYSNSSTTTSGMGNGIDSAVGFTVTATPSGDVYKNWEARASASNIAGSGTGGTITLDCTKGTTNYTKGASPTSSSYSGSCGNRTRTDTYTYTRKSGVACPNYDLADSAVSDPNCTSGCFTPEAVDCDGCGSRTYYNGSSTNCTSYYEGSCGTWNYYSSPAYEVTIDGIYYQETLCGWIRPYGPNPSCGYCEVYTYNIYQCSVNSAAFKVTGAGCCYVEFCY